MRAVIISLSGEVSSLSAEAQACGQPADIAEYICRFWASMLPPTERLRDCLDEASALKPCLITDAKALFDSYHREFGRFLSCGHAH